MKDKKNTLSRLGEFGLIRRLTKGLKADTSVAVGPGDDCAAIRVSAKEYLLLTADMLVEGVDFFSGERPELVGRKALAVSLSDIAACGGTPRYALVSLGIPAACPYDRVAGIFNGMKRLARRYDVNIVGGDISRCVKPGAQYFGCRFCREAASRDSVRRKTGRRDIRQRKSGRFYKRPASAFYSPPAGSRPILPRIFKVTSMIDVSDGLWQDLGHLMSASGTGAVIYADRLPLSGAALGIEDALSSGEDFELLFTMPLAEASRLLRVKNGFVFRQIGFVLPGDSGMKLVGKDLRPLKVKRSGYRHF